MSTGEQWDAEEIVSYSASLRMRRILPVLLDPPLDVIVVFRLEHSI